MSRSYIFPVKLLLFSFSVISFFLIAVPYANAGVTPPRACCRCTNGPCVGGTSGVCGVVDPTECENAGGETQSPSDETCDPDPCGDMMGSSGCTATIKCVCESKFSGATRVVPCPADPFPDGFISSPGPKGTLGVNCSKPLTDSPALCEDLDIHCKRWEKSNCLLTLPLFGGQVETSTESICNDGVDNDNDSLIDCQDPDCNNMPCDDQEVCTENDQCMGGACLGQVILGCD